MIWKLIDWFSDFLCRHGFHEWGAWEANVFGGSLFDWSRTCERCGESDWMNFGVGPEKSSPDGKPHPGTKYV